MSVPRVEDVEQTLPGQLCRDEVECVRHGARHEEDPATCGVHSKEEAGVGQQLPVPTCQQCFTSLEWS